MWFIILLYLLQQVLVVPLWVWVFAWARLFFIVVIWAVTEIAS